MIRFPRNIRSIICMTKRNLENYAHFPLCTIFVLCTIIGLFGFCKSVLLLCSLLLLVYLDFENLYYYCALYYYWFTCILQLCTIILLSTIIRNLRELKLSYCRADFTHTKHNANPERNFHCIFNVLTPVLKAVLTVVSRVTFKPSHIISFLMHGWDKNDSCD